MGSNNIQILPNFTGSAHQLNARVSLELNGNFMKELPAADVSGLCITIPHLVKLGLTKNAIDKLEHL